MKKIIFLFVLFTYLITLLGCGSSKSTATNYVFETEGTMQEESIINGDNEISSKSITLMQNFKSLGYFDDVIVNYFEDTNTFAIIAIFSNANSFDIDYKAGNWNETIDKYKKMILTSISVSEKTQLKSNYIISFAIGNNEMSIPSLVFNSDNLVYDYYASTSEQKCLFMLKNYFWQKPIDNTKNTEIEFDFDTNTYTISLWENDFNEQTIDVLMMENVSDSTKKLSSKLLKLIEYYNDSASIKLKILDGKNKDMNLLVVKDGAVTFSYLTNNDISFESGTYLVGEDIPAGEYALMCNHNHVGQFSVNSDSNGDNDIYHAAFFGNSFITIEDGQYITIENVTAIPAENAKIDITGQGMLRVGIDIPAGEYKLEKINDSEYFNNKAFFKVYSDDIATSMQITINDEFEEGNAYVTVNDGEYLKLDRCKIVN